MGKERPNEPRESITGPDEGPQTPFPIKLSGPIIRGFGRGSRELGIPTANIPPSGLSAYPDLESGVYYGFVGLKITPETTQSRQPPNPTHLNPSTSSSLQPDRPSTSDSLSAVPPPPPPTPAPPHSSSDADQEGVSISTHPAVLSIGYNPFYSNETRSVEIHILPSTFYPHPFPPSSGNNPIHTASLLPASFYGSFLNLLILGFIRPEYNYTSLEALIEDIRIDCQVAVNSLARERYLMFEDEKELKEFRWAENVDVEGLEKDVLGGGVKKE